MQAAMMAAQARQELAVEKAAEADHSGKEASTEGRHPGSTSIGRRALEIFHSLAKSASEPSETQLDHYA
jgi:hypothetical protein